MTTPRSLSRRAVLAGGTGVAALTALAACARGDSTSGGDASSITFVKWQDEGVEPLVPQIIEDFAAESGITVEQQASIPFEDYQLRFRTALAGDAPADVMELNDNFLQEMAGKNTLVDLTDRVEEAGLVQSWISSAAEFPVRRGGRWGVSLGQVPHAIYYNKTLFEDSGVPLPPTEWTDENWKWDDFLETAKALTRGEEVYGATLNNTTPSEHIWPVNNGGSGTFSDDGTRFAMADPEGIEAIQWIADLSLVHHAAVPWSVLGPDVTAANRMFAAGQIGMLLGNTSLVNYFRQNVTDFEWDVAPVPGQVRQLQETAFKVYVVPAKAANPDGAFEFLKYLTGPDVGRLFAENAVMVPADREAAEALVGQGEEDSPRHMDIFLQATEHHKMVPDTVGTAAAQALFRPVLGQIWSGELTAQEGLEGVRPQVEAAIAED